MKRFFMSLMAAATGLLMGSVALADPPSGVVTIRPVQIVGRVQRPSVVEIARVPVTVAVRDLRQPLVDRVERPVSATPF
jgi:hypothetical protein